MPALHQEASLAARPRGRPPSASSPARDRILIAARREFAARGFRGASTADIVAAAGVTPPALYHHFASKAGLYVSVIEAAYDQILAAFTAAVPPADPCPGGSFEAALDAVLACSQNIMAADPTLSALLAAAQQDVGREPGLSAQLRPVMRRYRSYFDQLAGRAGPSLQASAGERRSLARALIALVAGLNGEALLLARDQDCAELVGAMRRLLRPGAGSAPSG